MVNCEVERTRPIYDELVAKIRSDAQMPGSWVAAQGAMGATVLPQSAQTAELNASGLAGQGGVMRGWSPQKNN